MSTLVPLLNSNAVDGWDICNGWMTQETLRKYTKPTKQSKWRPKARRKDDVENGRRKMGIVNW
jgi:hypothetical protein